MSTNEKIINEAYTAFGQGDIAGVLDSLTDDVEWTSAGTLPHGGVFTGKAEVGRFFEGIGREWKGLDLDVELVNDAGTDAVVGVVRADGTRKDGTAASYGAVHIFELRHGAIRRFREYTDLAAPL